MIAAMIYCLSVPVLLLVFAMSVAEGAALLALGVGAFIYLQYLLVRRVHGYITRVAPPREASLPLGGGVCVPNGV